jgi:hypothetical protein
MPFNSDVPTLQPADSAAELAVRDNPALVQSAVDVAESRDPFWTFYEIDPTRWNQHFPYQLIIVKSQDGSYVPSDEYVPFVLPIPPQEIAIQMPTAISTSVTMGGGIIEEHNGAPFRMIHFQGTMGVMPSRPTTALLQQRGALQSVFAGTIQGAVNLKNAAQSIITGNAFKSTKLPDDEGGQRSGYLQWHLLQRFLETYINVKKTERGASLRLALAIWKDATIYLVTLVDCTTRKSASSPNEYCYSLAFKAWKRISLDPTYSPLDVQVEPRQPAILQQLTNRLDSVRRTLHALSQLAEGIYQDFDRVLEIMREVGFGLKDAAHAAHSFMDLPDRIRQDYSQSLLILQSGASDLDRVFRSTDLSPKSAAAVNVIKNAAVTSGKSAVQGASASPSTADPFHKIVANANKYYDLFANIKTSQLKLPPDGVKRINTERDRVRAFTRLDYEQRRDQLLKVAEDIGDTVGAGDASFNSVYNRGNTIANKDPTDDYYEILFQLNEATMVLNYLAASADVKPTVSPMAYIAGLARQSGIAFKEPASKFAVPFLYGSTLPQLAARYLGDPDRWNEIAALNGLRSPYVDEVGFDLPLLVDGRLNQVVVADATNLFVGQAVWVSAANVNRTQRHVRSIEHIDDTYYLVTLDGDTTLDSYNVSAGATLHAYLPDTLNSQMMLYIPSDKPINESYFNTKSIPGVDIFDNLIQTGGVDLLLTPSGDLAITPDGDCRLAVGLTNIIQRVRVAIATPRGSLLRHPDFGLGIPKGTNTADMDAEQLLRAATNLFKGDPVLGDIQAASVTKNGPTVSISVAVSLAGSNQVIPIMVQIQR